MTRDSAAHVPMGHQPWRWWGIIPSMKAHFSRLISSWAWPPENLVIFGNFNSDSHLFGPFWIFGTIKELYGTSSRSCSYDQQLWQGRATIPSVEVHLSTKWVQNAAPTVLLLICFCRIPELTILQPIDRKKHNSWFSSKNDYCCHARRTQIQHFCRKLLKYVLNASF